MFNLQGSEIIVILLIALVVLGPERLPDAVRRFMHTYNELKKMGSGFQSEIRSAFDEPMQEMRKTAEMVRDAADPNKFVAEAEAEQRLRDDATANAATPIVGASANGHHDDTDGDPTPGEPVVDPGSETVATPGSPPATASAAPARPPQSSTPPPPPPPFSASRPARPSTSTSGSREGEDNVSTPAPPPPPVIAPVTVIDPPPLPRRRPEDG
ncbi:MAG TPA: twin-arginine translocase TatA/TatE family subunit [Ilumatobacteraceae bacterium]|nr:twin-arginine translocase TatA/TatE family subunit [Ilumatobacteraceae bacterium]